MKRDSKHHLAGIYNDIAENLGQDVAKKMHYMYGGQQISFPKHFFDSNYITALIMCDYDMGKNIKELSKKYDYSERRIRQIIKENHKE